MADGDRRIGQEGSRWYNAVPTGKELGDWFKSNVKLHADLKAEDYVQGITLIPNTEKAKAVISWDQSDNPVIGQVENLVYTPYAKVETRIKYWNDWLGANDDLLGVIEPVAPESQPKGLPPGFFPFSIGREEQGKPVVYKFIACSMKVYVYERSSVELHERRNVKTGTIETYRTGRLVMDPAPATKMVPLTTKYSVDESALMKAETGAIGRALGMAGMLVIPGTGVATAEDMQEAFSDTRAASEPEAAELPASAPKASAAAPTETKEELQELRQQAVAIINMLKTEFPDTFEEFKAWAQERGVGEVAKVDDARVLQGMIKKADRELTNERGKAAKAAEQDAAAEQTDQRADQD